MIILKLKYIQLNHNFSYFALNFIILSQMRWSMDQCWGTSTTWYEGKFMQNYRERIYFWKKTKP